MKSLMKVNGNIYVAGVYGIRCEDSQEYLYLGSSLEINDALSRHLHFLKRGLYAGTNKEIIQEKYDHQLLIFEVIKESEYTGKIKDMSTKEKENLQIALSALENFYISLYKDTICNKQLSVVKHSSNKNSMSTIKRSRANTGIKNPNWKYDTLILSYILWMKVNGYKPKKIAPYFKDINKDYISQIGMSRWININPIKPTFIA